MKAIIGLFMICCAVVQLIFALVVMINILAVILVHTGHNAMVNVPKGIVYFALILIIVNVKKPSGRRSSI